MSGKITFDEELAYKLWDRGYSDCQIGQILERAPQTIQDWRKRKGLDPNYKPRGYKYMNKSHLQVAAAKDYGVRDI